MPTGHDEEAHEAEAAGAHADDHAAAAAHGDDHGEAALHAETGAHGGGHEEAGMPQLDFSTYPSQIFWVAIALFLLYRLLKNSIMPRIENTLEERARAKADDLDAAAEYKERAVEAEKAYHAALESARAKAQEITAKTQADIDAQLARETEAAEARIAEKTAEGEARIAEIRASASQNIRAVAEDAAEALIAKLAPGAADADALRAALDARLN